jgi:hypothetical protein
MEQTLWTEAYLTVLRAGASSAKAKTAADDALASYRETFCVLPASMTQGFPVPLPEPDDRVTHERAHAELRETFAPGFGTDDAAAVISSRFGFGDGEGGE